STSLFLHHLEGLWHTAHGSTRHRASFLSLAGRFPPPGGQPSGESHRLGEGGGGANGGYVGIQGLRTWPEFHRNIVDGSRHAKVPAICLLRSRGVRPGLWLAVPVLTNWRYPLPATCSRKQRAVWANQCVHKQKIEQVAISGGLFYVPNQKKLATKGGPSGFALRGF